MTDIKVPASGNVRVWWGTTSAFADYKNPTAAEINACLDISEAVSWNDFDFNLEASNQLEDPAITALGKTFDRGYANWGGSISFYYPKTFGDASSKYSLVYDTLDAPRTAGFVVMRADGAESTALAADGDFVHVLAVKTDGYAESVAGEEAFRYTVTMLPQGTYAARTCVGGGTPVVTPATLSSAAGDHDQLAVTWGGRVYTNGVTYTSSDATKATVSTGGVVTSVATGSAVITATSPDAGVATCTVTVS